MDEGMFVEFRVEIAINAGMTYIFKFKDEVFIDKCISLRDDDVIVDCCIEQAKETFCQHLVEDGVIGIAEFPDLSRDATFNIVSYTIHER